MNAELFAGIPVGDYPRALAWYERFFGGPPAFVPNDTESVWEVGEHRYVVVEVAPEHAGHGMATLFVDDFDARTQEIAGRGLEPADRQTYGNGVRKAIYRDPEGNELGIGGGPAE